MPGNGKKSPKIKQPKKKKRRVNSKNDATHNTKEQSKTVHDDNSGVSTANTVDTQPSFIQGVSTQNFMSMSSLQNPQPMQFQAPMQTGYPYSPPPPPVPGMGTPYNFNQQAQAQMNVKPDWATEMIDTVKAMSKELGKLSTIEKTLSGIKISVQNLESKVEGMEGQLKSCEKACDFLGKQYDDQKNELKTAKSNISGLQKRCNDLEVTCKDYEIKASKTHKKLLDLESRNMRENLVFHGLPENVSENCEAVVKEFCVEKLKIPSIEVEAIVLDRVHRIGRTDKVKPGAIRPIVAKFHRYSEREKVRETGYQLKDTLKAENLSVRPQLPSEVLENRKPLYSAFEKAKAEGSKVKFVLDKLYINGKEYIPPKSADNPK